jgi:hypothetical protein
LYPVGQAEIKEKPSPTTKKARNGGRGGGGRVQ